MEMTVCTQKIKCDQYGCKNMADFCLKTKKLFGSTTHYCTSCLTQMYETIGKHLVPKPCKTPFKTKKQKL